MTIFPNPTKEWCQIQFNEMVTNGEITVYAITVEVIAHQALTNSLVADIQLTGKSGVYVVKVNMNGHSFFVRVTKN